MSTTKSLITRSKLWLLAGMVFLTACSTNPREGSVGQYTSDYDRSSSLVNEFDIRSVTDAPEQIVVMFRLDAAPDKAFELVSELDQISTWFTDIKNPSVDNSKSLNGPDTLGTHSVRSCRLGDKLLVEDIVYYDKEKRAYAYAVNQALSTVSFPITSPVSLFTVETDGQGGSLVTWRHHFNKNFHVVAPVLNLVMKKTILEPAVENLLLQYGGEWVEPVNS